METLAQVISCEFWEISKNTFFNKKSPLLSGSNASFTSRQTRFPFPQKTVAILGYFSSLWMQTCNLHCLLCWLSNLCFRRLSSWIYYAVRFCFVLFHFAFFFDWQRIPLMIELRLKRWNSWKWPQLLSYDVELNLHVLVAHLRRCIISSSHLEKALLVCSCFSWAYYHIVSFQKHCDHMFFRYAESFSCLLTSQLIETNLQTF